MNYLLDSNACIQLLRTRVNPAAAAIRRRLDDAEAHGSEVFVCSVVRFELLVGALRSREPEANLAKVTAFLGAFPTRPFDDAAAGHASRIRAHLEAAGTPIGPMDILTAAIALAHGLTLVPLIGYDKSAALAKQAFKENKTVRQLAEETLIGKPDLAGKTITKAAIDGALDLWAMTLPGGEGSAGG